MRPLRYSINVTLDGCCDHREGIADEDIHRNARENIAQADALLLGRVTYQMMDGALRPDQRRGEEVRRGEHPGPGRLERGARARGSGECRSEAQTAVG